MNANIETAIMSLIGNDPRFQRAMTMLQGKTPAEICYVWYSALSVRQS